VCKEPEDDELKIKFLFDLFSDHAASLPKKALKDFCEIFRIPFADFADQKTYVFNEFNEVVDEYELSYTDFDLCKPMIQAMLCLTPSDD